MTPSDPFGLLAAKLHADAADPLVRTLYDRMQPISGPAGTVLTTQGQWTDRLYLLVDGTVQVTLHGAAGPIPLGEVRPGAWIGELQVVEPGPASATAQATSAFSALCLAGADVSAFIEADARSAALLIRSLLTDIAARLVQTSEDVLEQGVTQEAPDPGWARSLLSRVLGVGV